MVSMWGCHQQKFTVQSLRDWLLNISATLSASRKVMMINIRHSEAGTCSSPTVQKSSWIIFRKRTESDISSILEWDTLIALSTSSNWHLGSIPSNRRESGLGFRLHGKTKYLRDLVLHVRVSDYWWCPSIDHILWYSLFFFTKVHNECNSS